MDDLFVAGILPGALMLVLLAIYCFREGGFVRSRVQRQAFTGREVYRIDGCAWSSAMPPE